MKIKSFAVLALSCLFALGAELSTLAQGTAFTYQGRLNNNGVVATGYYDFQLAIFDGPAGGSQIGGTFTTNAVAVSNGLFTITLDFGVGVFSGANRWLNLAVKTNGAASFTPLTSLQQITAAPYAITAGTVTGVIPSTSLAGLYSGPVTMNNPGNVFNGALFAGVFTGNGAGLTGVNAATLGGLSSAGFWKTNGNAGANPTDGAFLGTTDNQPFEIRANNQRVLRLEPDPRGLSAGNLIAGHIDNAIAQPGTGGSTIAGGGFGGGGANLISSNASGAFIGAGSGNQVGPGANDSTIVVGQGNIVQSAISVIVGGVNQTVQTNAAFSFIGGGQNNIAGSAWSVTAGGYYNTNNGLVAFIGAGDFNSIGILGYYAVLGGGYLNTANGYAAVIGGGSANTINADYAAIGGGIQNSIQTNSFHTVISGGGGNTIISNSPRGTISGGVFNTVGAQEGTVSGGAFNSALAFSSTIGGGGGNTASGAWATISGGRGNQLTNADYATIGGGYSNTIQSNAPYSTIGGGDYNTIGGFAATIGGGYNNLNSGTYATVGGGASNTNLGGFSTVSGGILNTANALSATVGGGQDNTSSGSYGTVPGGANNTAGGLYSLAAGRAAKALHDGAFVWGDSTAQSFASTANDQFLIRAVNGVGINKNNPATALDVNGTITATSFSGSGAGLTSLNAASLTGSVPGAALTSVPAGSLTGTLADARLSANVALRSGGNAFTGNQTITGGSVGIGITPQSTLDVNGTARIEGGNNWDVNNTEGDFRVGNDSFRFKIGVANGGGGSGDVWMRAQGGTARLFIKTPGGTTFYSSEGQTNGVSLAAGGGSWTTVSDRNAKENFARVNAGEVLEKVVALPLSTWNYKSQAATIRHVGPMAQDFKAAFGLGETDTGITTVDADGVALAAIQGLNQKLEEQRAENAELKRRLEKLEQSLNPKQD